MAKRGRQPNNFNKLGIEPWYSGLSSYEFIVQIVL